MCHSLNSHYTVSSSRSSKRCAGGQCRCVQKVTQQCANAFALHCLPVGLQFIAMCRYSRARLGNAAVFRRLPNRELKPSHYNVFQRILSDSDVPLCTCTAVQCRYSLNRSPNSLVPKPASALHDYLPVGLQNDVPLSMCTAG